MPYTLEWLVPQRVIDASFSKTFTVTEFIEYDSTITDMLNTDEKHLVHILCDIDALEQFPNLSNLQGMKLIQNPKLGWAVLFGKSNTIIKAIGLIISKTFGYRMHWCSTREEALAFLKQTDKTLPELK
jgi:hypothetical protein